MHNFNEESTRVVNTYIIHH